MPKIPAPLSATFTLANSPGLLQNIETREIHLLPGMHEETDLSFCIEQKGTHLLILTLEADTTMHVRRSVEIRASDTEGGLIIRAHLHERAQLFVDDAVIVSGKQARITLDAKMVLGKDACVHVRHYAKVEVRAIQAQVTTVCHVLAQDDFAKVVAIPEFDVQIDDALTSHAVSIAKPDVRHVSYLVSRGLSREQAMERVCRGFLHTYAK